MNQIVDKNDPKSVASWLVANWMATCDIYEFNESHRRQNDQLRGMIAAELTKLKADVARLRRALELIRQIAAATDGGPVIMEGRRGMIGDLAARALEETK